MSHLAKITADVGITKHLHRDMPLKPRVTPASVNKDWQQHQRQDEYKSQEEWSPPMSGLVPAAWGPTLAQPPPPPPPPLNPTSPSAAAPVAEGCKDELVDKKQGGNNAEDEDESTKADAHQQAYLASLARFVEAYFDDPASDLDVCEPPDWSWELPRWISELPDPYMADLAAHVHQLWRILYRKASDSVHCQPECHTLLPLPRPFVIPGDRFRECYNWDSFWIVQGLLASGLHTTARDLVVNLLSLVDTVGHIPNGARSYYTNRSQPPLISAMVMAASGLSLGGPTPMHIPAPISTNSPPATRSKDALQTKAAQGPALLAKHDEGSTRCSEGSTQAAAHPLGAHEHCVRAAAFHRDEGRTHAAAHCSDAQEHYAHAVPFHHDQDGTQRSKGSTQAAASHSGTRQQRTQAAACHHDQGSTHAAASRLDAHQSSTHVAAYCLDQGSTHTAALCDLELLQYALPRLVSTWQYWNRGHKVVHVHKKGVRASLCGEGDLSQRQQSQHLHHHQQQQQQQQEHQQLHCEQQTSHLGPHEQQQLPSSSTVHALSRYYAEWQEPRPESYR
ncbi:trehalase-domain-containing protein [Dunaliella salina]|uniref:alpha,alpha-trehalase n=1 Tax=Dunaliella salina TaxID=3046 RepID=A0ABQ7GIC6_DUNSA|nr:trehalase-domain-containing protein [Dunaliella salina]|eukprot:KAF5834314.1 trehalase-domain-containing protein [Dunaliella salina]